MAITDWKRGDPIGYINKEIPEFDLPAYSGKASERLVPATLDVAERADLAIHFLTNVTDPDADHEIYFPVDLQRNPPIMYHDWNGANIQPKFQEALPLLRSITGNRNDMIVDETWTSAVIKSQGEDGLLYMPVEGRPWARYKGPAGWFVGDDGGDQFASLYTNGIMIGVMGLYYLQTRDEMWKTRVRRLIDRMAQLMIYKGDWCYYPVLTANPGTTVSQEGSILDPLCLVEAGGSVAGWIIHGLCQAYNATGYEPGLDLAGKLSEYLMRYSGCYDDQARFLGMAHTHHHLKPLIGLLEYGLIVDNAEIIEFARKGYEYARSCGVPSIGYYPSIPGPDVQWTYALVQEYVKTFAEGCTEGDFVAIAAKLSGSGVADYWDDLDRCIRNTFFESQMLTSDWIGQMTQDLPATPVDESKFETADRLAERHVGTFASWGAPNDMFFGRGKGFMHCCAGNETRAIYYIWDNILSFDSGNLKVNLLLNRTSRWADLDSYIPFEGRVDLTIKEPCALDIRIPEWVQPGQATGTVNGETRRLGWNGRYAQLGDVKPGDVVSLRFPISERTVKETIDGVEYTMGIKGNDVVHMDPPGKNYPYYQRKGHYRENETRWLKRPRFVSSQEIHWR